MHDKKRGEEQGEKKHAGKQSFLRHTSCYPELRVKTRRIAEVGRAFVITLARNHGVGAAVWVL